MKMADNKHSSGIEQKPVIFLAFANDRVDRAGYLRNLATEQREIRKALEKAKQAGLCEVIERSNATSDDILDIFQDKVYKDRIAVFHYAGHADCYKLLLESVTGARSFAFKEGLVSFFARQNGLKLIFLNACSTEQHAVELKQAGIPAVITMALPTGIPWNGPGGKRKIILKSNSDYPILMPCIIGNNKKNIKTVFPGISILKGGQGK
jgi:hypothetical protein